ncbi:MAG: TlpA family protein disulfide reductase [Pirellulales bacterium]|nr:TlpA family protein disulfide reductase [Pirellulales bacterium]
MSSAVWRRCRQSRLLFAVALAGVAAAAVPGFAQAPAAPAAKIEEAPDGSTAEILKFIEQLAEQEEPEEATEEEQLALQRKVIRSIAAAAAKAIAAKPATPEEEAQAYFYRLQGLALGVRLELPDAADDLAKAVAAARKSKNEDVAALGLKFFIEGRLGDWPNLEEDERAETIAEILAPLEQGVVEGNQIQTVMTVADFLEMQEDLPRAVKLLSAAIPLIENSDFPRREDAVKMLGGVARRLSLPGKTMALEGTLLDGTDLDWSQYEGKVVLVDFWATWCGPCRAELPNVLNMYKSYHEQGFEVLGISLDDDPKQAASFIEKMEIPWATLFSDDKNARGWEDPRAVEYGVTGIPLAILLDQEGKVVSLQARGDNLKRELHKLLGPPKSAAE